MLDPNFINTFQVSAHRCAMEMMPNAACIRRELVNVTLPEGLEKVNIARCDDLTGTKFDVISELIGIVVKEVTWNTARMRQKVLNRDLVTDRSVFKSEPINNLMHRLIQADERSID